MAITGTIIVAVGLVLASRARRSVRVLNYTIIHTGPGSAAVAVSVSTGINVGPHPPVYGATPPAYGSSFPHTQAAPAAYAAAPAQARAGTTPAPPAYTAGKAGPK